jgi:flagellar motility protein MotE (MotC chaperone)
LLAIMNERPQPPAHGGALADITLRMLHKDPEHRANADQVLAVLESIVGAPPASRPPAPPAPPEPAECTALAGRPQPTRPLTYPVAEPPSGASWRALAAWQSAPQDRPTGEQPALDRPVAAPRGAVAAPRGAVAAPRGVVGTPRRPAAAGPQAAQATGPAPTSRPNHGTARNGNAGNRRDRFAEARDMIKNVGTDTGVAMLLAMSETDAARILADCPPKLCGDLLQGIGGARPATAAAILRMLRPPAVGRAFAYLRPQTASSLVAAMTPREALRILDGTDERAVAAVLMELPVPVSAKLVNSMHSKRRAAQVLTHVRPSTAAELLRPDDEFAAGVLRYLPEPVRKQVSRHLTAGRSAN